MRRPTKGKSAARGASDISHLFSKGEGATPLIERRENAAEARARLCEEEAQAFRQKGAHGKAKGAGEKAAFWRSLPTLSDRDVLLNAAPLLGATTENLDALYAIGDVGSLMLATGQALGRLFDLAGSRGTQSDVSALLETIAGAVERFERFANEKPELFRPLARERMGIPAIVSQNREKMAEALNLAEKLETGAAYHLAILPTGKKGRHWQFKDRANALAARLVEEIEFTRSWDGWYRRHEWWEEALKLETFSKDSWKAWAEFAWEHLLDKGKHPAFYDPETQICNVRESRRQPYPKKPKPNQRLASSKNINKRFLNYLEALPVKFVHPVHDCSSIAEWDIKEALFGAFELIASGTSSRTKRRQKSPPKKRRKGSPDN